MSTCLNEEILLRKKKRNNNNNKNNIKKPPPTCKATEKYYTREIFQSDRVVESSFLSCVWFFL